LAIDFWQTYLTEEGTCEYQKNIGQIGIPEEIDIGKYLFMNIYCPDRDNGINKRRYQLRTIICHSGGDMTSRTRHRGTSNSSTRKQEEKQLVPIDPSPGTHLGHYYIATKDNNGDQQEWRTCDDLTVKSYSNKTMEEFFKANPKIAQDMYLVLYC